jgi:sulfate adenylyltransferase subunit 1 (EFTu-like GTPase family)
MVEREIKISMRRYTELVGNMLTGVSTAKAAIPIILAKSDERLRDEEKLHSHLTSFFRHQEFRRGQLEGKNK